LLPADVTYNSFAYIEPSAGAGTASLAVRNLSSGKMDRIVDGELGDEFENNDFALDLGYGFAFNEKISAGLNVRGIQSNLDKKSANAIAGDIGIFSKIFQNTKAGLTFHNFSTSINYSNVEESFPFFVSGSLSQNFKLYTDAVDFTISAGVRYMDYKEWQTGIGIEHTAYDQFSLRAGYDYDNMDNCLSFPAGLRVGIGINIYGALVDYAWVPYGQMGYTHRIGLGYRFGKSKKKGSGISINTNKNIYSPGTGNLNIYINWGEISKRDNYSIEIKDSYGITVKNIELPEGVNSVEWDGKENSGKYVIDVNYLIKLFNRLPSKSVIKDEKDIIVDNTPPEFELDYSAKQFSPDGDDKNDILIINVTGSDNNKFESYSIKFYNSSGKIVKKYAGSSVPIEFQWDGKDDYYAQPVQAGEYSVVAAATDIAGNTNVLDKTSIKVRYPPKIVTKTIKIEEEEKGLKINLTSQVLFGQGKAVLKEESHESLDEVVSVLNAYEKNKVSIEGHTDSVGSDRVNKKVSLKRANAVKEYILEKGIKSRRITVEGWGEEKPIASNRTRAGQMSNRRVEIIILKDKIK
ncbi:MAG: PorV/PorQ family protein, partial [Elusimicrobia bacterium]|nr:PorV/PorQ family protein [Elusimicrobiota bacterium]